MKSQNQLLIEALRGNATLDKLGLLQRYTIIDNPSSGTLQVVERSLDPKRFEWVFEVIGTYTELSLAMTAIRSLVITGTANIDSLVAA